MPSVLLNVPIDIPWTSVGASSDMMDKTFCDGISPAPWRSSIALYAYQPMVEDLPTELCSQRIVYLKVSCTITGFQPSPEEAEQVVRLGDAMDEADSADLERIAREYLACYGVLLNVGVFPASDDIKELGQFPHIIDFEPKVRDLYQAATTTGEVLTSSTSQLNTTKGFVGTEATQNSWKGGGNVTVPLTNSPVGPTAGANIETGQIRTVSDQQNWGVTSDASQELQTRYVRHRGYRAEVDDWLRLTSPVCREPSFLWLPLNGLTTEPSPQDRVLR
jgi:hypothetical protein